VDDARGVGRADGEGRVRRPRELQQLPQRRPAGRHGPHGRPHLGQGRRFIFGTGSGWFERDYDEYGYEFGTPGTRLTALAEALPRIEARWEKLVPVPTRKIPVLIGGKGEQKTLRIVARHADIWHSFVTPEELAHKISVIDEWAAKDGTDVSNLVVSNELQRRTTDDADALYDAGVRLFTLGFDGPDWDFDVVRRWLQWRDGKN
jgi:alkanesulfonate monooxygenase SsuD/methylene tetrahydromethanopterin reductase-like flavin-dependent oxidoreductase (luciferase family)